MTKLVGQFADGETSIKVEEGVRGKHVYVVCSTTDVDRLMELLLSISTMRRASAGKITAIIPYYGYGRQDQGQTVAAADVARMLQIMDVDHVITVDLHSSQIEGFFSPNVTVDNLPAVPIAAMYLAEEQWVRPIVIAPHAHTVAMAQLFRRHMATEDADIGMGLVIKQHLLDPLKPGELVGNVHGCDCIIVDKLVDTAKTLLDTARLLKDHGARSVTAFCVHGRFSSDAIEKIGGCEDLDRLIITDTITPTRELEEYREKGGEKIETLTIAPMLAETMSRIHKKSSVSELQA